MKNHIKILGFMTFMTLIRPKSLFIKFNKVDEFVRIYDGFRYSVLFGPERCDVIYNRVRYLISKKGAIIHVFLTIT